MAMEDETSLENAQNENGLLKLGKGNEKIRRNANFLFVMMGPKVYVVTNKILYVTMEESQGERDPCFCQIILSYTNEKSF